MITINHRLALLEPPWETTFLLKDYYLQTLECLFNKQLLQLLMIKSMLKDLQMGKKQLIILCMRINLRKIGVLMILIRSKKTFQIIIHQLLRERNRKTRTSRLNLRKIMWVWIGSRGSWGTYWIKRERKNIKEKPIQS